MDGVVDGVKNMKNIFKIILFPTFILSFFVFSFIFVQASSDEIYFSLDKKSVDLNEEFLLNIEINSVSSINAVEGRVKFNDALLEFKDVREGGGVISFWVEKPHLEKEGSVFFSGITPLGFSGQNSVFSLVFKSEKSGQAVFSLADIKILRNDGKGTKIDFTQKDANLFISTKSSVNHKEELLDQELPEDFTPVIGNDEALFGGQNFVAFSTVDKISGVDHYEVREGRSGEFKNAVSPYLLQNQNLNKIIYIKAVDKKGNERIIVFDPQEGNRKWYNNVLLFAIIIVLFSIFYFHKKLWPRSRRFVK